MRTLLKLITSRHRIPKKYDFIRLEFLIQKLIVDRLNFFELFPRRSIIKALHTFACWAQTIRRRPIKGSQGNQGATIKGWQNNEGTTIEGWQYNEGTTIKESQDNRSATIEGKMIIDSKTNFKKGIWKVEKTGLVEYELTPKK